MLYAATGLRVPAAVPGPQAMVSHVGYNIERSTTPGDPCYQSCQNEPEQMMVIQLHAEANLLIQHHSSHILRECARDWRSTENGILSKAASGSSGLAGTKFISPVAQLLISPKDGRRFVPGSPLFRFRDRESE